VWWRSGSTCQRSVTRLLPASLVAAGLLYGAPAPAAVKDGNALLQQCTATVGAFMEFCFGYIDAIADSLLEDRRLGLVDNCFPAELDDVQLRDIVVKFLRENYDLRRLAAPGLVAQALSEAYPCK
jgi:Ssp1 endopeptidase immunity protein Rap1a